MCRKEFFLTCFSLILGLFLTSVGTADLIGYWPLDNSPDDHSGNGYDGVAEGGVAYGQGVLAMGSDHNGSDALINCGDVPMGDTGALTVAFWVHPRNIAQDWAGYVSKWTLDNAQRTFWIGQHSTDGWLRFGIYPTGPAAETSVDSGQVILANGEWTHITCTYDGHIQRIYAGGVEVIASPDRNAALVDRGGNLRFGKVAGANWFNGLLDDVQIYSEALSPAKVQEIMQGISQEKASGSVPSDGATDVLRDESLSWIPGKFAAQHNVYFGADSETVSGATVPTAAGLDVNSFDPGRLDLGKTYFWRVDEVNGTPDKTVFKGDVWRFTVEPFSIQIPVDVDHVTASSSSNNNLPAMTVNGSGLDGQTHSTASDTMWLSGAMDLTPWLMYEFNTVQKLDQMWIWNSNTSSEGFIGWGIKDVALEYSMDGTEWHGLADSTQISRASGLPTYSEPQVVNLGLAEARYVRINILSNWGGLLKQYGVSEVQFLGLPVQARQPMPASGSSDILPDAMFGWRAGRQAETHRVYVSTDMNAVAEGTAESATFNTHSMDLGQFAPQLDQTYYWRVDEVNDTETMAVWPGPVWQFSTVNALVVDDFEGYGNLSPNRPFQTWLDGYGYSADEFFPVTYAGNGTGAGIGHDIWGPGSPHFDGEIMETVSTRPGSNQAMPFYYSNTGGVASETERQFVAPQDWTLGGARTLSINFRGQTGNTGTLYAKINETKVLYPRDPGNIALRQWQAWNIDLASLGTDLRAVTSLSIGVEGPGATGMLLIDDMTLQPKAGELITPLAPNDQNLVAYYALDGNVTDNSGRGANGTVNGNPMYETGIDGQAIQLNGIDDFIDLGVPANWPSGASPRTLCAWAQTSSVAPGWRIIAGYGAPVVGQATALVMNGTSLYGSGYGSDISIGNFWAVDEWHHVGLTYDGTTVHLFADGIEVTSGERSWNTVNTVARLGRQVNEANEFWEGRIDEVRLYDRVLSLEEMAWLGGKTAPIDKPF